MIKHLRIDNRLIHGQVAVAWQKYINAKVIIICNDAVAKDPIQKMALPLAARESKVLVYSIEETLKYAGNMPMNRCLSSRSTRRMRSQSSKPVKWWRRSTSVTRHPLQEQSM